MIPNARVGDTVIIATGMCKNEKGIVTGYPENLDSPYNIRVEFEDGTSLLYKYEEVYKVETSV